MKNRKSMVCFVTVLVACSAVFSSAARKDEVTLLMVPREEETVRLGVDIANKYPTLLISYKLGANNTISLHGWTGAEWVNVTLDAFHSGDFFKKGPDSALVVEKAGVALPGKMLPPPGWCVSASKITTTEMRPLLHLVGQYYDFSFKDWEWFAKRYNMDMDTINPEGLNVAWYHKPMSDHMKLSEQQGSSDLQYWVSIRQPAVVTAAVDPVDTETDEPGQMLTNDAPAAVVLGAADASEEHSDTAEKAEEPEAEERVTDTAEAPAPTDEAAVEEKASEDPAEQAPADETVVEEKTDEAAVEEKASENPEEPAPKDETVTEEKASENEEEM